MDTKCKSCSTTKDEKKMLRCKFTGKNINGVAMYGHFCYWYFCNDNCLSQYQGEPPIEVKKQEK